MRQPNALPTIDKPRDARPSKATAKPQERTYKNKTMRLTIDKTHDQYLQAIASQMGVTPKDALNFLLWKLREAN